MGGTSEDEKLFERRGAQWLTLIVPAVVIIVAPGVAGAFMAPGAATAVTLVVLFGTALVAGVAEGLTFRLTIFLPLVVLGSFFFASALYFNDGVWFYGLLLAGLAALGAWLTARFRAPATAESGEE